METGIAYGASYDDVIRGLQEDWIYLMPPENTDTENNQPELATKMSAQNGWLRCSWEGKAYTYVYDSSKGWSYKKKPDEDYMKPAEGIGTDDLSDEVLDMIEEAGESGFELPNTSEASAGDVLKLASPTLTPEPGGGLLPKGVQSLELEWAPVREVPELEVETPMNACLRATGKSGTSTPSIVEWQPVREVPESASTDEGKVLTVDSNGDAVWGDVPSGSSTPMVFYMNSNNSNNVYTNEEMTVSPVEQDVVNARVAISTGVPILVKCQTDWYEVLAIKRTQSSLIGGADSGDYSLIIAQGGTLSSPALKFVLLGTIH